MTRAMSMIGSRRMAVLFGTLAVIAAVGVGMAIRAIGATRPEQHPVVAPSHVDEAQVIEDLQREPVGWVFGRMVGVRADALPGGWATTGESPYHQPPGSFPGI